MKKKHKYNKNDTEIRKEYNKTLPVIVLSIIFLSLTFLLFYNQFISMEKFSNLVSPYARWGKIENFNNWIQVNGNKIWSSTDHHILKWIMIITIIFILLELITRILQNYIKNSSFSDRKIIFFIIIAGFIILRSFYASGNNFYSGDSSYFIYLDWLSYVFLLKAKIIQFWHFFGAGGCAFNQFYGFIHNIVTGFINLFINNFHLSVKFSNLFFRIIMAIGVYLYIRELTDNKKAAFISSMACLLIHHINHAVIYLGRYSTVAGLSFAPYIFYFFERYINKQNVRYLACMSLLIALMIFTHLGGVYWMLLSFGLYTLLRIILLKRDVLKKLSIFALFGLISLIIASPFLIGFLAERKSTGWYLMFASPASTNSNIDMADSSLFPYILWNNFRFNLFHSAIPTWQIGYMGITLFILLVIVLYYFIKKQINKNYSSLIVISGLIFIFFLGYKLFFYMIRLISPIYLYGLSRFMILYVFYLSCMAGIAYMVIKDTVKKKNDVRVFLIILFIIFLDLFPATFQDAYTDKFGGTARPVINFLKDKYSYIKNNKLADFNIMLCAGDNTDANNNWRTYNTWLIETEGVPNMFGHLVDTYVRSQPFISSINSKIPAYLKNTGDMVLPDYLRTGLNLLNIKYIVAPATINKEQFKKVYDSNDLSLCELNNHTPALASLKISTFIYTNYFKNDFFIENELDFLKGLTVDDKNNSINYIVTGDDSKYNLPDIKSESGIKLKLSIITNIISFDHIKMVLDVNNDCYVRFAFSNYPDMEVRVNNKKILHFETLEGMIFVRLQKGISKIEIIPHLSKLRKYLSLLSSSLVIILFSVIFLSIFNKKSPKLQNYESNE